ncbi:MAG: hypothetical protein LBD24_02955 [Spirochaetaceae bacterium]|jgi:hypothetical protein|nr:hypothetical protein [Spirochaetaceae bacterium]
MKLTKLFLTGMAALLSFGLLMTGCDSGGDSDDNENPPPAWSLPTGSYVFVADADSVTAPQVNDPLPVFFDPADNILTYWDLAGTPAASVAPRTAASGAAAEKELTTTKDAVLIAALTGLIGIIPDTAAGSFKVGASGISEITIAATEVEVSNGAPLFVPGATVKASNDLELTVTSSLTIGTATDSVKFEKAVITLAATATLGTGAGVVSIPAADDFIVLENGGKIIVAGAGRLVLSATEFHTGTYTASGAVTITAANSNAGDADTIETAGADAGDALTLGGQLKLGQNAEDAGATYSFTAGGGGAKVIIAGATITVPKGGEDAGAGLATDGGASIVLGTGSIVLGADGTLPGFLTLAEDAIIGVFATATKGAAGGDDNGNATVTNITDGAVLGSNVDGSLDSGTSATLTVGSNGLDLTGPTSGTDPATINASTVITTNTGTG